jgi:glycine hydroxymethyltransferase
MLLVDCKSVVGADGTPLSGDIAARILDLAGIVCNRNTIPGDPSALRASGIRLGTPWITQRGFGDAEVDKLAHIIADVLQACVPFSYTGKKRPEPRAKIDYDTLQHAKLRVRDLAASMGIDTDVEADGYPHFYYHEREGDTLNWQTLFIRGAQAENFLDVALTCNVRGMAVGEQCPTRILRPNGAEISRGVLERAEGGFRLHVERHAQHVANWFRSLSDGFVIIDPTDPYAKVPGPVDAQLLGKSDAHWPGDADGYVEKAYFIGVNGEKSVEPKRAPLPTFHWEDPADAPLKTTPLHALHRELGAKMTAFAGYDMPVWYSSVSEEHAAVRKGAGVFDVTHMGVFDVRGGGAADFLHAVTTNDVLGLPVGDSQYTYLLDVHGVPLDDLMIYRLAAEHYLVVVNASNNDKNWAWLNAVIGGTAMIEPREPGRVINSAGVTLRDLRNPAVGQDMRVDVALQGPNSKAVLLGLGGSEADKAKVNALPWAGVARVTLGGYDLIVSRTGYTGERVAYELFVHPDQAEALFRDLIAHGATPCGLAARDSLRIEAGLPLYGHELAGPLSLSAADAGFSNYVRLWKPFFVGKAAFIARERTRDAEIVRFRLENRGARPPHQGDPVVDRRGRVVGVVTSASIDSEGYQLGQAYLKHEVGGEGAQVSVFCGAARANGKPLSSVGLGDRVTVPEPAVVLSRFPKKAAQS